MDSVQTQYPVMPLKNTVLFPQQVIPIYVGRKKSLQLIDDLDPESGSYEIEVSHPDHSSKSISVLLGDSTYVGTIKC